MRLRRGEIEIGGLVVAQRPNPPLYAAAIGAVVSMLASDGSTLEAIASAIFYVAFSAWAWEELAQGVNWFRRLLGGAGLVLVAVSLAVTLA